MRIPLLPLMMESYPARAGEPVEALRMKTLPEGSGNYGLLVEFLRMYCDASNQL